MDSIVLGRDCDTNQPVMLQQSVRDAGLYVIGQTRSGKTSLLLNLMLQDIEQGYGLCFLDPHGDAIDDLIARLPRDQRDRVILLDAGDQEHSFGINFFEVDDPGNEVERSRVAEQAVDVLRKIFEASDFSSEWGIGIDQYLLMISHVLAANPNYTLAEIPPLLEINRDRTWLRRQLLQNVENPIVLSFWERFEREHGGRDDKDPIPDGVLRRVEPLLTNPLTRRIFGQAHSTINFRHGMDTRKIVLGKLALNDIGDRGVNLLGAVIVGMVLRAAYSRADTRDRPRFHLYADEYQRFATRAFATLLAEAGKYGVCTLTAHQDRQQLYDASPSVAKIKANNVIVFKVDGKDGEELAREFDRTPGKGEVIGYEAELVPAYDAVNRLVKDGHRRTSVVQLTREFVAPVVKEIDRIKHQRGMKKPEVQFPEPGVPIESWRREKYSLFTDCSTYHYWYPQLESWIEVCNRYLNESMSERFSQGDSRHIAAIADVLSHLRGYIGFAPHNSTARGLPGQGFLGPSIHFDTVYLDDTGPEVAVPPDTVTALRQVIRAELAHSGESTARQAFIQAREHYWQQDIAHLWPYFQRIIEAWNADLPQVDRIRDDVKRKLEMDYYDLLAKRPPSTYSTSRTATPQEIETAFVTRMASLRNVRDELVTLADRGRAQGAAVAAQRAAFEYQRLLPWVRAVITLGKELAEEPIRVATGQHIPRYQQQTHADREAQIANMLTSLPQRRAKIKILVQMSGAGRRSAEYFIDTIDIPPGKRDRVNLRVAFLRQQNVECGYVRPGAAVQAEIRRRQEGNDPPTDSGVKGQQPTGPRPSRRSGPEES